MPGIWLDDDTYAQTAGQLWAQQATRQVHAGESWAQQAMQAAIQPVQDALGKLQSMVPAVPAPAAAAPTLTPTPPPPMPTPAPSVPPPPEPVPAAAPPLGVGQTPVAEPVAPGGAPTPPSLPAPPSVPAPPSSPAPTDLVSAGQNWAQQQIQNLLNPSPVGPQTPSAPTATASPIPGLDTSTTATTAPGTLPAATPTPPPAGPAGPQPNAPGDLIDQTRQAAMRAGIDPDIFSRQINQESGFNPNVGSPAGAQGIAQFMPDTARGLGIDPSDPGQALPAAANLMASYLQKYGGDWSKALAAYNAGPGNVDKYGGVPPFDETQTYVKNILGGAKNVVQQGLSSVNTAVQGVQSAVAARASQFGLGLSSGDAMAFCGPTAAIAFAQTYGRNPTVDEAKQLAQQVGWNPDQGMAGPQSEVSLLKTMGVDAHATSGVDWAQVGRDASGGNPVIIDTPGHYYYVDGYNQQTGQLHVGTSGTDLKGGSEWMTPDQINSMPQSHGGARAAIFADHPLAQQDGLAQSVGRGQNLTMGTMQPAQPDLGQQVGQVLGNVPLPMIGLTANDIGASAASLQQGRDLIGSVLQPDQSAPAPLRAKADSILQAVQDVGSKATQAGADLLQQGQDALQQAPQTVSDILSQNALTSQGIPNIGGNLLEGAQALGRNFDPNAMNANPLMPSNILSAGERALGTNVITPAVNALLPGGALEQGRQALGGAIAGAMPDVPVLGGLAQAAGGMLAAPSVIEQMQTMDDLNRKYGQGLGPPDPSSMTPEDRERLFNAQIAIGGMTMPGREPASGAGMLANALDQLRGYPEEIAGPIRAWAGEINAPASQVASTVQRWIAENPIQSVAAHPSVAAQAVADLTSAVRGGGYAGPRGPQPGQLGLFPEQAFQPHLPQAEGGLLEQLTDPNMRAAEREQFLRDNAAQVHREFDQMQADLDRAGMLGQRTSAQTVGGQAVLPGMQPGAPVTMAERARLYHVGNVISSTATLTKVALNSMFNPAWSFLSRGAADIAGATPLGRLAGIAPEEALGRAQGSVIGAQGSLATWGQEFLRGFSEPYTRASSLAARETNPLAQMWARAWETPGALHNAFQTAGQSVLEQMELGRLAGQDAAAQGLKGQDFVNEVANLMANPRPGWTESARGVAQRAVLRGDLGTLGQYLGNMAGQGAVGGTGGTARQAIGNVLFPVFRIGMNALTQGVEKSPLGLLGTGIDVARAALGSGPYRAAAAGLGPSFERPLSTAVAPLSERLTNNLVGTAVTAALAKYAADGSITGGGPTDPSQRAVLLAQGWQPNSIRTPAGYVSYQGTPLEVPAGLVGEFADALNNPMSQRELQQPAATVAAERLFAGTVNMFTSRTGLETLGQLSDMIHTAAQDPEQAKAQFGTGLVANVLGGYVPMAGPLRDLAKATDPLMRQPPPGDLGAALGQNIPFAREQVQPRIDVLGRAVSNPQQGLGAILPARLGAGEENPIAAAMGHAGVAPATVPQTIPYGPANEIRLMPAERTAYEQYRGQVIQQAADALVRSPQWQQMPEYAQRAALQNIDQTAAEAAGRMVLRDIGPSAIGRMVPTGVLAPVQGYQAGNLGDQYLSQATLMRNQAQHAALMQSLLGGQTGLQRLQAANAAAGVV